MSKIQLHPFAFYMSKCCLEFEATELVRVALSKMPSQFVALWSLPLGHPESRPKGPVLTCKHSTSCIEQCRISTWNYSRIASLPRPGLKPCLRHRTCTYCLLSTKHVWKTIPYSATIATTFHKVLPFSFLFSFLLSLKTSLLWTLWISNLFSCLMEPWHSKLSTGLPTFASCMK